MKERVEVEKWISTIVEKRVEKREIFQSGLALTSSLPRHLESVKTVAVVLASMSAAMRDNCSSFRPTISGANSRARLVNAFGTSKLLIAARRLSLWLAQRTCSPL